GLKVGVRDLTTGLSAALDHGVGKATLHPTKATIVLAPPGQTEKTVPLALDAVTFDIDEDRLKGSLKALAAGALALESVDVSKDSADGSERRADAIGLHVDAKKLNELLGRNVVASDADVELHVSSKGQDAVVAATARTSGGSLHVDGTIGIDPVTPTYDL